MLAGSSHAGLAQLGEIGKLTSECVSDGTLRVKNLWLVFADTDCGSRGRVRSGALSEVVGSHCECESGG